MTALAPHPAMLASFARVIRALREGLGVEDIEVQGICTADYAREIVAMLRAADALKRVLGVPSARELRIRNPFPGNAPSQSEDA